MSATPEPIDVDAPDELTAAITEVTEILSSFSVPLYYTESRKPVQFGTGFFVRAGDHAFLISAAHVFDQAKTHAIFFYSSPSRVEPVTGQVLLTKARGKRADDHEDIGVVRLPEGHGPPYPDVGKYAMDISYLKRGRTPRSGKHYITIGFPATKSDVNSSERSVYAAAFAYRADSVDDQTYSVLGLDPMTHIVLPLDVKRARDANGKHVHFPKPQGMSGAPLIEMYDLAANTDSHVFPVVGVAIEYRKTHGH